MAMEALEYLRALGALALVLALMLGAAYALRRWSGIIPGLAIPTSGAARRLAVVETLTLNPRARLVIVRRDNVEHLILLRPDSSQVIEGGIAARLKETTHG